MQGLYTATWSPKNKQTKPIKENTHQTKAKQTNTTTHTKQAKKDLKTHTKYKRRETETTHFCIFKYRKKNCCRSLILIELGFRKPYTFFQFNIAATQKGILSCYGISPALWTCFPITQCRNDYTNTAQKHTHKSLAKTESKVHRWLPRLTIAKYAISFATKSSSTFSLINEQSTISFNK